MFNLSSDILTNIVCTDSYIKLCQYVHMFKFYPNHSKTSQSVILEYFKINTYFIFVLKFLECLQIKTK